MGLPHKLKNMNLYDEGVSFMGEIGELTPPTISHATEDWRGGGMLGPVKIDNGLEALEFEWTLGGYVSQVVSQMGELAIDGVMLRAMGAFQSDQDGGVKSVELVMRGRHTELDRGTWKPGDDTEKKLKTALSYYKEIVDGTTLLEIDMIAGIYKVGGVDRYAQIRAAIGG
ncbi:phage major tail tube protein [Altericroceibacterium endophyticum]|uniref:Phage major tail tube protein n=1 Tax=Altericroceibacterium endophyticum TaxID=1808508 RepID=A0A6I4T3M5_9SPHN|nr:phage major tail tube protein [Altericroceibacterium endophyticum]MXO64862.1 phage major tail tube protein [Altericroceibacterium endophyticum]